MNWRQALVILFSLSLWACASLTGSMAKQEIQTWVVVPKSESDAAHLRHHNVEKNIDLVLSFDQAAGFKCYSPENDLTWRNRMSALEATQGGL